MAAEIERLRAMPYQQLLLHLDRGLHSERLTPTGALVQRETFVWLDDARTLRVLVDASQPGRGGCMPPRVSQDGFIRATVGSFVGE